MFNKALEIDSNSAYSYLNKGKNSKINFRNCTKIIRKILRGYWIVW